MFEDFAEKTVLAIKKAEELAQQLKDESVATGHIIYGLCVDRSVCLHHIFQDLNVDPDMFSGYVNSLPREPGVPNGPFNRHVKTVFERAKDAAQQLGTKRRARAPGAGVVVGESRVVLRDAEGVLDRP
jgi:ATP-dependent Clp protease ATP-binding subunit ClpA